MATYQEIAKIACKVGGFGSVKTCWIAHVLSDHHLTSRTAPNRITPKARVHPCPDSKRPAIEEALRRVGML